jgi:predicted tellurium resistance membrane protein TerC
MALVATVLFQLVCSTIFYLVLAEKLKALEWLQYFLGVSLLFAAYQAVTAGEDDEFDIMETKSVQFIRQQLGDRLVAQPAEDRRSDGADLAVVTANGEGQICLTMGGLMLACLMVADFVLEIDVTLSKIEELQDRYLCLSSSALAAFTMPDIFRLAESLFRRYSGLKYAVGFVLLFIGMQMLLHRLFTIPALLGVAIIVTVMCLSIAASAVLGRGADEGVSSSPPRA